MAWQMQASILKPSLNNKDQTPLSGEPRGVLSMRQKTILVGCHVEILEAAERRNTMVNQVQQI
jgi:hypothetical protein